MPMPIADFDKRFKFPPPEPKLGRVQQKTLDLLRDQGPLTTSRIRDLIRAKNNGSVRTALQSLAARELVIGEKKGAVIKWRAINDVQSSDTSTEV